MSIFDEETRNQVNSAGKKVATNTYKQFSEFSVEAKLLTSIILIVIFWAMIAVIGNFIIGLLIIGVSLLAFLLHDYKIAVVLLLFGMVVLLFPALIFITMVVSLVILVGLLVLLILI